MEKILIFQIKNILNRITFNIKEITFPTSIKDVKKFVKLNEHLDIKVNIFFLSEKKNFPFSHHQ
jgi:hypothetical protein